eukprot:TRINITY_DN8952_c0_g1_i1.p1 TRINITY_DN8952_c0_g1~~TRINITY_DN8952_c0_g1_i1.p1  ORF type:complete len:250 (-),score=19.95 TRINITY_DN8952_c0_g1_i1:239-988(-)
MRARKPGFAAILCATCLVQSALSVVDRTDAFIGYSEKGASIRNKACLDENSNCKDWAQHGECERNPQFMGASCRLSCGTCQATIEVGPHYGKNITLATQLGEVHVELLWDSAPAMCSLVAALASSDSTPGCKFYRNEAIPEAGSSGPPYALLQGVLGSLSQAPLKEAVTQITRGHVATIHPGKDFYIALAAHESWSEAHTAWGYIPEESMAIVEAVVDLPYRSIKHDRYGTEMRMLVDPVQFTVTLISQ